MRREITVNVAYRIRSTPLPSAFSCFAHALTSRLETCSASVGMFGFSVASITDGDRARLWDPTSVVSRYSGHGKPDAYADLLLRIGRRISAS